jgi:hypothetical protein
VLTCADCKSENRDTAKFCRGCGISLSPRQVRQPEPVLSAAHLAGPVERPVDSGDRGGLNLTVAHIGAVSEVSRMTEQGESQDSVTEQCCSHERVEAAVASSRQPVSSTDNDRAEENEECSEEPPRRSPRAEKAEDPRAETHRRRRNARPSEEHAPRSRPTCPSCGSNVRSLDKFCIWCGQKQPERMASESKRCPDCGMVLPVAANFCFACGHDVEEYRAKKIRFPTELFEEADPELVPKFEA